MSIPVVSLEMIKEKDKEEFKNKIQEAFGIAITKKFGKTSPIPSEKELDEAFSSFGNETYIILNNDRKIGGAVVKIDQKTQHNSLELFFIYADCHSSGLGQAAWKAIEERYPETKIWETVTPYFEKRNINFYINKCGFHIVEFCNKHHRCSNKHYKKAPKDGIPGTDEFFIFQKVMK